MATTSRITTSNEVNGTRHLCVHVTAVMIHHNNHTMRFTLDHPTPIPLSQLQRGCSSIRIQPANDPDDKKSSKSYRSVVTIKPSFGQAFGAVEFWNLARKQLVEQVNLSHDKSRDVRDRANAHLRYIRRRIKGPKILPRIRRKLEDEFFAIKQARDGQSRFVYDPARHDYAFNSIYVSQIWFNDELRRDGMCKVWIPTARRPRLGGLLRLQSEMDKQVNGLLDVQLLRVHVAAQGGVVEQAMRNHMELRCANVDYKALSNHDRAELRPLYGLASL
ncbi:hypothetical protein HDU98_005450 [Podochytrium sp. JEL0797]|nr:hypothetical protein HDU98_005450 [Podochytrium sp. JEL0797]